MELLRIGIGELPHETVFRACSGFGDCRVGSWCDVVSPALKTVCQPATGADCTGRDPPQAGRRDSSSASCPSVSADDSRSAARVGDGRGWPGMAGRASRVVSGPCSHDERGRRCASLCRAQCDGRVVPTTSGPCDAARRSIAGGTFQGVPLYKVSPAGGPCSVWPTHATSSRRGNMAPGAEKHRLECWLWIQVWMRLEWP
jgi:hypothetical protein